VGKLEDALARIEKALTPASPEAQQQQQTSTPQFVTVEQFTEFTKSFDELKGLITSMHEAVGEEGTITKAVESLKEDTDTHREVLEKMLDRVDNLDSASVIRKSLVDDDGEGGSRKLTGAAALGAAFTRSRMTPGRPIVLR